MDPGERESGSSGKDKTGGAVIPSFTFGPDVAVVLNFRSMRRSRAHQVLSALLSRQESCRVSCSPAGYRFGFGSPTLPGRVIFPTVLPLCDQLN
jgi:hypothetical protein